MNETHRKHGDESRAGPRTDHLERGKRREGSKTILFRGESEIAPEEMRYKRLFYAACSTGLYYTDTFQRGIMFYSLASSSTAALAAPAYLEAYLLGKSDYEIWRAIQRIQPIHDYYDFNKRPSEQ